MCTLGTLCGLALETKSIIEGIGPLNHGLDSLQGVLHLLRGPDDPVIDVDEVVGGRNPKAQEVLGIT